MAWMRTVAGRMKSDYSYSGSLVYNNYPFPPALRRPDLLTIFSEWIESRSLTQSPNTLRTYRTFR